MKHAVLFFLFLSLMTSACTPTAEPSKEEGAGLVVPTSPAQTVGAAEATAVPPTPPVGAESPEPAEPTVDTLEAAFHNLRFTAQPDGSGNQTRFPPGTEEIYAVWEYSGLAAGDEMERLWYFNGEPWLERQENWDFDSYGASGTLSDVSIYDYEGGGLILGDYTLVLRLNGVVQVQAAFTIGEGVSLSSSSETYVVEVVGGRQVWVTPLDGEPRLVAEGLEIVEIIWLPDGEHFLFVEQDSRDQIEGTTLGIKHALWLVEGSSGTVTQLSSFEEDLHSPVPAPDMRTIALISGSNYFDACGVDRQLWFMMLDGELMRTGLLALADFDGAPVSDTYWVYPDYPGDDKPEHLIWTAPGEFQANINATCIDLENAPEAERRLPGQYLFDMQTALATRIGDLTVR